MADENLDIRARLTADDRMSSTVRNLLAVIDRLEKKAAGLRSKPIIGPVVSDKDLEFLRGKGQRQITGLTQTYIRQARALQNDNKLTSASYADLTGKIDKALSSTKKLSEKRKAEVREQVKLAQAMRYVLNQEAKDRVRLQERTQDHLTRLEYQHAKRREKIARDEARAVADARNRAMRNMRRTMNDIRYMPSRRHGFYSLLAAGGVGYMAARGIQSANDLDRSEANARINMEQDIPGYTAREVRNRILPKSVAMGQDPAKYLQTVVEAAKAGVPEKMAETTAEVATMIAKSFGIDVDQTMEGMGYAIAQELGAGRIKGEDIGSIKKLGNITSYLAAKTAARPDQMLGFLRTGLGGGAMLGMSQEATLAFGAAGVQAGAQGQQTARFLGSMGTHLAQLTMEAKKTRRKHDKSPKDREFLKLPALLGYGGYEDIENRIRNNPDTEVFNVIKSFKKISDPLKRKQAMSLMFGQEFSRFLSNMINSPEMLDRTLALAKEASSQTEANYFYVNAFDEFKKSLEFMFDRIKSVWKVLKAELGDVVKPYIEQFSQWISDWYSEVKSGDIKNRFGELLRGLTEGFLGRKGSFRDLLDQIFGKPGSGNGGDPQSYLKFGKGFAEGITSVISAIVTAAKTIMGLFGQDSSNPEAVGKFTGQLVTLVGALMLLAPVIGVFTSLVTGIIAIASVLTLLGGLKSPKWIGKLGGKLGLGGILGGLGIGSLLSWYGIASGGHGDNSPSDVKGLIEELKKEQEKRKSGSSSDSKSEKHSSNATDFSSSNRKTASLTDGLADQLKKLGANVERVAFMSYSSGAYRGASGGGSIVPLSTSGSGSPMNLFKSTPGGKLPSFGVGRGGIIKSDGYSAGGSSGGLNKSAYDSIFAGTPMAGMYDQVVAAAKANGIDPALLAGVMAHESGRGRSLSGNNPGGIMDPQSGWSRKMQFGSLGQGIDKTASVLAKNYRAAGGDMGRLASRYAPVGAANDPRGLNGNWLNGVNSFRGRMSTGGSAGLGVGAKGDVVGVAERYLGKNEYRNTGEIGNFIGHDPRGFANAWCARFVNASLAAVGGKGTGSAVANSYQRWGTAVTDLAKIQRGDVLVEPKGRGYNQPGGHVGFATGQTRMVGGKLQLEMLGGNQGDSVTKKWVDSSKLMGRRGISPTQDVPSAIQNVPSAANSRNGSAMLMPRGGGSPVSIAINGNSHDPEALALLVQRRIDESMNWRTHDTASEYT